MEKTAVNANAMFSIFSNFMMHLLGTNPECRTNVCGIAGFGPDPA
jgi:hypothetical protein